MHRVTNIRGLALTAVAAMAVAWGCGGSVKVAATAPSTAPVRDSMRALEYFVEGAMHDLRSEYADAILEYEEALRYDNAAPIAYAIAKDYYELRKPPRAAQYADLAIARDSLTVEYRLLRARIAMNLQMDFGEAQHQFEAALVLDSLNAQTLSSLATLYRFRGLPHRSVELYERLMDMLGAEPEVGTHLADLYLELGEPALAIDVIKRCLREDPDNAELQESLAATYLRGNLRDSAANMYADIVDRYPDDATSRRALAVIYTASGNWPAAFAQYRAICADSTVEPDTLFVVIDSLYEHVRLDSASVDSVFAVVADLADDDSLGWYPSVICAGLCLTAQDDSAAHDWVDLALSRSHDSAATLVSAAQMFLEHERFADVLALTDTSLQIADFRIEMLRGFALSRLKRTGEAIDALYRSLQLNPRNWLALGELALYHEEFKRFTNADSAFDAAIRLKPDYATALNNYSYSLAERGEQLDRAHDMCRRALDLDPHNPNFLDTYGWIFYKMSRLDSAVAYLQQALNSRHPSAAVMDHLGDARFQRGERDEALRLWMRALELDSLNETLRDKIKARSVAR